MLEGKLKNLDYYFSDYFDNFRIRKEYLYTTLFTKIGLIGIAFDVICRYRKYQNISKRQLNQLFAQSLLNKVKQICCHVNPIR